MIGHAVDGWHIVDADVPMPPAERIIYADGAAGPSFRPGVDLELSHWVPTTTPERWAADTSTEACVRFVEDPPSQRYDLVVNNHLDTDGILSLLVLVHPSDAVSHRATVIGAAEMGDFNAGVDRTSFALAQELTALMGRARGTSQPLRDTYRDAFDRALGVLEGCQEPDVSVTDGWHHLELGAERVADGAVSVERVAPHLVAFLLPSLADDDLAPALRVPPHNALVDGSVWLWPHVRNRAHGESVHLVSVPSPDPGAWFHDVWLPGYTWAQTPDRWRPPGATPTGGSNVWAVDHPALDRAVAHLARAERGPGQWTVAQELTPFSALTGRGFPIVASCLGRDREPTPSTVHPQAVAEVLAPVFDGA